MEEYSKSVAEAASVVDGDVPEENLLQLKSRPPSSMLVQLKEDSKTQMSLVQQLQKLNLTPD